jgi:hypothetical protein
VNASSQFVDDRDIKPFPTPCPPWCAVATGRSEFPRHLEYEADDELNWPQERIHEGPTFGAIKVTARERLLAPGVLLFQSEISRRAADDLRELAADALAAAEWIEAHK